MNIVAGHCGEDEVFAFISFKFICIVGALLNLTFFFRLRFSVIEERALNLSGAQLC